MLDRKAPGPPHKLSAGQRAALAAVVETGPDPAVHGVVRWRRCDLAGWLREHFGVSLSEVTVGRSCAGWVTPSSPRAPRHYAQDEDAVAAFKKTSPDRLKEVRARLDDGVEVELWWQDEARVGQKNKITRRWARRGTRPSAPKDQRTTSAYIFGAICPKERQDGRRATDSSKRGRSMPLAVPSFKSFVCQ